MTIENYAKKGLLFLAALALITVKSFSQATLNDGIAAFNKGLEEREAENYTEALEQFNDALKIADALGDEGEDLKVKIEALLPQVYYQIGMSYYNERKIDEAIDKFKETIEAGKKYNDGDAVMKASNALSQLYYYKGSTNYKQEKYNDAVDYFRKAIEIQSDNVKAYYMIEAVYKSLDNDDSLMTAAKKSMQVAKAANDNKYYQGSRKLAKDYFLVKANSAKDAKKFDEALKYVKYSLEFDTESPTTYLLLVQIYASMQNWDEEIAAAEKGLEYEKKDPADQAKFYYEIGNAYKEKGENEKACEAFKKASVGAFKASADYQIQYVLKCE